VRLSISLLPKPSGLNCAFRLLPVMITRLLLSIKKAAALQEDGWNLKQSIVYTMRSADHEGSLGTRDEIRMNAFASTGTGVQVRSDGAEDVI
jgi:hypothetical protein